MSYCVDFDYMGVANECFRRIGYERLKHVLYTGCTIYTAYVFDVPFDSSINYDVVKIKQQITIAIKNNQIIRNDSVLYIDRGGDNARSLIKSDYDTVEKSLRIDFSKNKYSDYKKYMFNRKKNKRDTFILKMLNDTELSGNIYYNHMQFLKNITNISSY